MRLYASLRRAVIILTLALPVMAVVGFSVPAQAQYEEQVPQGPHNEQPLPAGLQGVWSGPDCTTAKQVFVMAGHYAMFYRPGFFRIGAVQTWRQEDDDGDTLYQLRTNANNETLIKKTNDGLMKIRLTDVNPLAPLKSAWGLYDDQTAPEFAHCAKLFDSSAGINQDEVNAAFLLDTLYKACRTTTSASFKTNKACQKAIFEAVDSNRDKLLDHAELVRIYRQTVLALSSSSGCGTIGYPENVPEEAEEFATLALGTARGLSFDQVTAMLTDTALDSGRIFTFLENARNTQNLLPFMPVAVRLKTCAIADPAYDKELGTVRLPETVPVNSAGPAEGAESKIKPQSKQLSKP